MIAIEAFFQQDTRVEIYRPGECDEHGKCLLYWMQHAQRGEENEALNTAISLANELHLPVVVAFIVTDYPAANLRHYHFMLEGIADAARKLQRRGTPLIVRHGEPAEEVSHLVRELQAAALISDQGPLRIPHAWRQEFKDRLNVPFACVDADVVVPSNLLPKEEWAARTIRPKIQRLLPSYLQPIVDLQPCHPLHCPPCDPGKVDSPLDYLDDLKIDRSVEPSTLFHGGQDEGRNRFQRFMKDKLTSYAEQRNQPALEGTSQLSAYLHFGQIAVQQIAWEIEQYRPAKQESHLLDSTGGRAAYLEELIVRRELATNFTLHNPRYATLEGCPTWGQETLRKHAHDRRPWLYSRDELEHAATHDELWNASQREMAKTGRMHGYMRMYWAKKILEWVKSPEQAFEYAVYLNDKYEIDGRDANGYTGIAWAIGGKHDRPWGPERPVFGLIRYMSGDSMKRKIDTRAYTYKWSQ